MYTIKKEEISDEFLAHKHLTVPLLSSNCEGGKETGCNILIYFQDFF